MDGTRYSVTVEEFRLFHGIDRALFVILVRDLCRHPSDCLYIMGLWLWLERAGFYNFISKVLRLPPFLIDELADEAMACLGCLNDKIYPNPPESAEIPLTHSLGQRDISLQYFRDNRLTAFREIENLVNKVCLPSMYDIVQNGPPGFSNQASVLGPGHIAPSSSQAHPPNFPHQVQGPNFPHQVRAPNTPNQVRAPNTPNQVRAPNQVQSRYTPPGYGEAPGFRAKQPRRGEITKEMKERNDRTMFVTFSKGYPVSENEVRRFFTKYFGNCIEEFHMQEVRKNEQALYARIMFYRPSFIRTILDGELKAKFNINGKHVWMRKFVVKEARRPCGCLRSVNCNCYYYYNYYY